MLALALVVGGTAASGCVVREQRVATGPRCRGAVWIDGHHGPRGRWHPGHWRCPGVVERIEID
ncbi:MAG TPA: hypothetical protein VIF57_19845 [Polyangia bacterium]